MTWPLFEAPIKVCRLLLQLRSCDAKENIISELPLWDGKEDIINERAQDILDCIFSHMWIRNVARTSILSRHHIWASYPQLVFHDNFFKEIYKNHKQSFRHEFLKAINNALLLRGGPIFKFILHIPKILDNLSQEIDQWMLFLSRHEIRDLELRCLNLTPYLVPSCIFLCRSLLYLELHNCILKPPHEFEGFHLVSLKLVDVSISADFSATLLKHAPLLEKLTLICCGGIEHGSIYAPRLSYFCIMKSGEVDWQWFARNEKLSYVQIQLGMEVKNVEKKVTMMKFLKDIPKLDTLLLDGFSLEYLATSNLDKFPLQGLIPSALLLTTIFINDFRVDDLVQISSALCLLRNSPNLLHLELEFGHSSAENKDIEHITEYLKLSNCIDVKLDKLEMVKKCMKGIEAELLFIKLLLGCSSVLQKMVIEESRGVIGYLISREIKRLYRASWSAEIMYVSAK